MKKSLMKLWKKYKYIENSGKDNKHVKLAPVSDTYESASNRRRESWENLIVYITYYEQKWTVCYSQFAVLLSTTQRTKTIT